LASCKGANAVNLSKTRVVIVGARQAGGRAAEAFRAAGRAGPITLIDDEAHLPYERPQLPKSILLDRPRHGLFYAASSRPEKRFTGPTLKTLILN
jgi:p-cumate 2,3-dioxygenase ferredoxin reductase component